MSRSTFIFLFNFVWLLSVHAQNAAVLKRNGEKAFEDGRWAEAKSQLSQYQSLKPGDFDVLTKLGISSYHLGQGTDARRYLEYVVSKMPDKKDPDLYYYLARTLHSLSEWDHAIAAYKGFMRVCGEKHPLRANAADNIRRCASGMQIGVNQDVALVENLGDKVNTADDEFAPLPSLNHSGRIYYAAARKGCEGGQRNDEGFADDKRGHWCSDMFVAQVTNRGWDAAGSLGGLLNTSRFEIPLGFDASGQVLYFFRGFTTYAGEFFADTAARKDEYALDPPKFNSPMRPEEGDCNPYFYNEKTIIFSSRREGGQGGYDLWLTTLGDTAWTAPVNLGPEINSAYDEITPFLARDGKTLYLSSNRPESMGGLDVFSSVFDESTLKWEKPQNAGTPVNSPDDDAFFRLSSDGQTGFISSDRLGGFGERDLYIVYFKEAVAAQTGGSSLFIDLERTKGQQEALANARLPAILFENDRELSTPESKKVLQDAADIALKHPETGVLVTVFSDDTGQSKFDLYTGIKSAEVIGKALLAQGIPAARIQLRSVGAAYPLARTMVDGVLNPVAGKVNHRAEITFTSFDALTFDFQLERPQVGEKTAAAGIAILDQQNNGLSFRVEATTTQQILANDAISMFGDNWIESVAGSGAYQYLAGYFQQFDPAARLMKELQGQGFTDAHVVAYINGRRISKAESVAYLKKYPELRGFIRS